MNLRDEYLKMIQTQGWSPLQQIELFLSYASEFKLEEHFLSYIASKKEFIPATPVVSDQLPSGLIMQMMIHSKGIKVSIAENAQANDNEIGWTHNNIIRCVEENLSIRINPDATELLEEFGIYFNYHHQQLLEKIRNSNEAEKDIPLMDMITGAAATLSSASDFDNYFMNIEKAYKKK